MNHVEEYFYTKRDIITKIGKDHYICNWSGKIDCLFLIDRTKKEIISKY
jgi:hypothetical protein